MGDKRFKNSPAAALITPDGQKVNLQLIFGDISTEYINCNIGRAATSGSKIHLGTCGPDTSGRTGQSRILDKRRPDLPRSGMLCYIFQQ